MPNEQRGEVTINLGGKDRVLKYDMNALAILEEHFDCGIEELMDHLYRKTKAHKHSKIKALNAPRISDLRFLIFAGLTCADDSITEMNVGGWIDTTNMSEVVVAMNRAYASSLPVAEGKDDAAGNATGPKATTPRSTGKD